MLVPLLLTLVTFAAAVAGAITPLADSTAGKIVVCALMLISAALTVAIEYRKGLEDEASRRELGQLVSLAEPPPQLMQDLRDAASTVLTSKTSRYRRVDLYPRQGQQFLEMFDANDGKLVGLFLFVGDDLASLVGLKGRRLEHALTTLLLQPVGDRWNSDAVYRISQILQTWFSPHLSSAAAAGGNPGCHHKSAQQSQGDCRCASPDTGGAYHRLGRAFSVSVAHLARNRHQIVRAMHPVAWCRSRPSYRSGRTIYCLYSRRVSDHLYSSPLGTEE